ncbi:hypothetical protein TNCV_1362361 [Trichonephila clavipes]|nr:hypothetical protein TNCV_1362361 [Trichonephila clavipes]
MQPLKFAAPGRGPVSPALEPPLNEHVLYSKRSIRSPYSPESSRWLAERCAVLLTIVNPTQTPPFPQ